MSEFEKEPQDSMADKGMVDANDGRNEGRPRGRKKRKVSYLTLNKIDHVDFKDLSILQRFMTERGKITPARQNGNTAKQQRMISNAIKRAREMALIPFVVIETTDSGPRRRPMGDRPERGERGDRGERGERAER